MSLVTLPWSIHTSVKNPLTVTRVVTPVLLLDVYVEFTPNEVHVPLSVTCLFVCTFLLL